MNIKERLQKYKKDNDPTTDVLGFEWNDSHVLKFLKQEIDRDRDRIIYEFDEIHQVEYELDNDEHFVIRDFFTGNEWVTLQLIIRGERGKILDKED